MTKKRIIENNAAAVGDRIWIERVIRGLGELGVEITETMAGKLAQHVKDMLFWNKTTNLTSITDPIDVAVKHVIDSGASAVLFNGNERVLDLGTGGGFPGIPLKIIRPNLSITLVDSSRKKMNFVRQTIRNLSLDRAVALEGRGEELAVSSDHYGCYDVVISRAFSGLDSLVPMALPYLKEEGRIIAMKGKDTEHETELFMNVSVKMPDGSILNASDLELEVKRYDLPGTDFQRAFMIIRRRPQAPGAPIS
jgi:16S rRNA (guanine527-N7)-methyltransferase